MSRRYRLRALPIFGATALVLASTSAVSAMRSPRQVDIAPHDKKSILVRRKTPTVENAPQFRGARLERKSSAAVARYSPREPFEKFQLPDGVTVEQALAEIRETQPDLEAYPDIQVHAFRTPNDTLFGQSWGLSNGGQTVSTITPFSLKPGNPGTSGLDIGAKGAWDYQSDCSTVVVAVIDTGIRYTHADLAANMWTSVAYPNHGYDFYDNDNDPADLEGHGTHVAAIIGAVGDNALGTSGICWSVQLMAVRVLGPTGAGATSNVINGINFAVAQGAHVINLSLGAPGPNTPLSDAIAAAEAANVVVVTAAGNDRRDNDSVSTVPCNAVGDGGICVAALDQSFALADFSNYGATKVHVGAPGVNIVSHWNGAVTEVAPSMTSGWTIINNKSAPFGWGYDTATLTSGSTINLLVNPKNFLTKGATYAASSDDRMYRTLDASGADQVTLSFLYAMDTRTNDSLQVRCAGAGGDPFPGGDSIFSHSEANSTLTFDSLEGLVPPACQTASATFGFQLLSDASTQGRGTGVGDVVLRKTIYGNSSYAVISGTSQATPYVAGIAALVRAFRPTATASRVVEAIKNSGRSVSSLAGKTTTGKAVHALGALSYLAAPKSVAVELVAPKPAARSATQPLPNDTPFDPQASARAASIDP